MSILNRVPKKLFWSSLLFCRVVLQFEFTRLHLDDALERLKNHESKELAVPISTYVNNKIDIRVLMEEGERVRAELEDEICALNGAMQVAPILK